MSKKRVSQGPDAAPATPRWETGRMNDKRPSGAKTLAYILLAMLAILAVIVALGVWATRG